MDLDADLSNSTNLKETSGSISSKLSFRIWRNCYYSGPVSDHFDGVQFFNTSGATADKSLWDWIRWKLTSRPSPWPQSVPVNFVVPEPRRNATRITVVGHATVLIQSRGLNLVTDPVWSERGRPLSVPKPETRLSTRRCL
jgi:hypothetical protein